MLDLHLLHHAADPLIFPRDGLPKIDEHHFRQLIFLISLCRLVTTTGKMPTGKLKRSFTCRTSNPPLLGGLSKSMLQPAQVLWQISLHTYLSRSKTSPVTLSRRTFSRHVAYPVRLHLDSHAQHGRCFTGPGDKELNPNPNILRRSPYRSDSDRYECSLKLPCAKKRYKQIPGQHVLGPRTLPN